MFFYIYIYCTYCISTLPDQLPPHKNHPLVFLNPPLFGIRLESRGFFVRSGATPRLRLRCESSRGQLWNKSGKSTNNAMKETTQRRPDGNGARSLKEKTRGRFSTKGVVILSFFWVQIIDFSYSYKLPVKLWRDFWGHLTLQQQNIRAYD